MQTLYDKLIVALCLIKLTNLAKQLITLEGLMSRNPWDARCPLLPTGASRLRECKLKLQFHGMGVN